LEQHLRVVLRSEPKAVAVARARVAGLRFAMPEEVANDVRLLVSELLTNAVKHAGLAADERIRLDIRCHPDRVEGVLHYQEHNDFDPTIPVTPGDTSGWGLFVVDRLADRWSIVQTNGVLEAWFEIELPSP
jgi:anti-sigma regulatory factor (Ser/Thr protein kinase)